MKDDLIRRASRSENEYNKGESYKHIRNTKKEKEKVGKSKMKKKNPYSILSTKPLRRFLNKNIGRLWDDVYSEVCERIPIEHREKIFYEVYKDVDIINGKVYSKPHSIYHIKDDSLFVHPQTKILMRVKEFNNKKKK